jgi:CBS domain containing-hemolysin-like protein
MTDLGSWLGIALCLSQAAALSGLNLAVFSLSLLRLEAAAGDGDEHARRVLPSAAAGTSPSPPFSGPTWPSMCCSHCWRGPC